MRTLRGGGGGGGGEGRRSACVGGCDVSPASPVEEIKFHKNRHINKNQLIRRIISQYKPVKRDY